MLTFAVFFLAGCLVLLSSGLGLWQRSRPGGPRAEGISFVGAVLIAALFGWAVDNALHFNDLTAGFGTEAISIVGVRRGFQLQDAAMLLLTGGLYVASAWRGARGLPAWVADLLLVIAAAIAVCLHPHAAMTSLHLPFARDTVELGFMGQIMSVAWIWLMARMTAALNRTPQVTGGYLGIVALTFLLLWQFTPTAGDASMFPPIGCAALAGAGLVSVPLALQHSGFNLGWSGALAMGFLLAQIAIIGVFNTLAFAILALLLLVFGLPILDVSFYRLRAARRGETVTWEQRHLRLHKALQQRGIAPMKISLLYLALTAYLCGVGVFFVTMGRWHILLRLILVAMMLACGFIVFFSLTRILMRRGDKEEIPEAVEAFGVRLSAVTMTEALDKIEGFIHSRQPHHVVTSDANAILRAQEDTEYAGILQRAALITPDGYGVIWGARLLNLPIYERVTGVDMVTGICERGAKKDYSIYILGSAPGVASTAAQKLAERYPGLRVAGTQHGYFEPEEEQDVVQRIREAQPDVLFVAFGIPKQEKFIARHMAAMNVPVSLGVGGSFDVYSEKLKRAPDYIQRVGMEWLYRVWQEPWRWKRMGYVPRFMVLALREWIFGTGHARRDVKPRKANL